MLPRGQQLSQQGESEEFIACWQQSMQAVGPTLALKFRVDVTRSPRQGYQWHHKSTNVLHFFLLNTDNQIWYFITSVNLQKQNNSNTVTSRKLS